MTLAEHAFFLERGEVRFDGSITDLLSRDDLLRPVFLASVGAALGNGAADPATAPPAPNGTPVDQRRPEHAGAQPWRQTHPPPRAHRRRTRPHPPPPIGADAGGPAPAAPAAPAVRTPRGCG